MAITTLVGPQVRLLGHYRPGAAGAVGASACSPLIRRIAAEPEHHEHLSPSTGLPTEAKGDDGFCEYRSPGLCRSQGNRPQATACRVRVTITITRLLSLVAGRAILADDLNREIESLRSAATDAGAREHLQFAAAAAEDYDFEYGSFQAVIAGLMVAKRIEGGWRIENRQG